jgi:integrase-like protein
MKSKNERQSATDFVESVSTNQQKLRSDLKAQYDFVVCGAGSSGSVVARRLAENQDVSVLLLEAGGSDDVPSVIEASQWPLNLGTERDWAFQAQPNRHLNDVPCHHRLDQYLHDYIEAVGIGDDVDGYLFRTARSKTGQLTTNPLFQQDAHRIIRRRAKTAGVETRIGNHTSRATGITAYLKNSGKLEVAQQIANHESPRTTKLYDRRHDEISLDEIERITI